MNGHLWLCLPFEEGVVQLLIIDVDLSHFRPNTFAHLCLQCLLVFLLLQRLPHLHNAGRLDELRKIKRWLFYPAFTL